MNKVENLRFELLMDAGNGAQKAGDILIKAFAKMGVFVYIEPIIPAEISPPKRTPHSLSGVVIRLSSTEITNIGSFSDIVVVEHEILLKRRFSDNEFDDNCIIFLDQGFRKRAEKEYQELELLAKDRGHKLIPFEINQEAEAIIKSLGGNGKNMFYLGILCNLFNVKKQTLIDFIRLTFKKLPEDKLQKNISIFDYGYNSLNNEIETYFLQTKEHQTDKILLDGNTALSLGIIDSGIKLFSGYPITPASTIMHNLARIYPSYDGVLHQAEDEISAIGTVLGSYFAGVPAITATSGPGLSLKQEFIGLSVSSEIPCIVINVQRGGPSTGLPTRTEQADLFASIFGSHGDSPKVVLSVSNVEDCFYVPHLARYITEKCRVPVIILSDYLTSVSYRVLDKLKLNKLENVDDISSHILENFFLDRLPQEIPMVKDNQANPGVPEMMRRATGLNTNNEGFVEYTSESNHRSHVIRNDKIKYIRKALKSPEIFGDSEGDLLIVGWGSSRGAIFESVNMLKKQGVRVSGLHFKCVYPLPLHLEKIFEKFKNVVTVEMTYADTYKVTPFAMMLRSETLIDVKCLISDATGRPLKPVQIIEKVTSFLKEVSYV